MATAEHCLYCFDTLAAHLERREPMSLNDVSKSYAEYRQYVAVSSANAAQDLPKQIPALRRLAASSGTSSNSSNISSMTSSSTSSTASLQQPTSTVETPSTSTTSLEDADENDVDDHDDEADPITESPLFVTWNIESPSDDPSDADDYSLRGCIGTFESQPLADGLASYAITAAIHDTRFNPVTARELPHLQVVVTLLTDFEDVGSDPMAWTLGTHGLRISFYYHGKRYGATYLPDVAPEQGWTKEETVVSLMRKAGWMGRKEKWREVELRVVRYQGKARRTNFADYKRWREWVDAQGKA